MILLMHKSEYRGIAKGEFDAIKTAAAGVLDDAILWEDTIPSLRGHDVIGIFSSVFLGSTKFNTLAKALEQSRRLFAIIDDEWFPVPTQVRQAIDGKKNSVALTHLRNLKEAKKGRKSWAWVRELRYLNTNILRFEPKPWGEPDQLGVLYYGAFRKWRKEQYVKFLTPETYPVTISTKPNNVREFYKLLCPDGKRQEHITFLPRLDWRQIRRFMMTVYMHDADTGVQVSPACRFYECLSWGVAQVFAEDTVPCFKETLGIDVSDFVVRNNADVLRKLGDWSSIRITQSKWASLIKPKATFKRQLLKALKDAR